jgi:hypothetical protein
MQRFLQILVMAATIVTLATLLHAQPFFWFTNSEQTRFGMQNSFWQRDTLDGPVHSNGLIYIMQDPVFTDVVSTTEDDFWRGSPYNPQFIGPPPRFNVPRIEIPDFAGDLRGCADRQGHYYSTPNKSYFAHFSPGQVTLAMWTKGQFMDTVSNRWTIPLAVRSCIFVDGPLYVYGIVGGAVSIGASEDVQILDDIRYQDVSNRGRWISPNANHSNYLGIVSEQNVKIANTPANGRGNSSGRGNFQTNQDSTSVVITASVVALGESFTFEQQNDADSGYVCDCSPDDRGTIYFMGSLIQMRRGYMHRSTRSSTGYLRSYHYDHRLRFGPPPGFPLWDLVHFRPDTVYFGDVIVGQTAVDTVEANASPYGALSVSYPFTAQHLPNSESHTGRVLVRFTPPRAALYTGVLTVGTIDGEIRQIQVRGRGVHAAAPPLVLDVSPNPFNLTTTIRYSLPEGAAGKLAMFDILGRTVREFDVNPETAGDHSISFHAAELASGVYFIRLQAGTEAVSKKVLLLK